MSSLLSLFMFGDLFGASFRLLFFFFNDTATTEIYTLSLHDALPILQDLYAPQRRRGTLLSYHHHRVNEEFLQRPGDQDLTAHLDFTALRRAAEARGARCLGLP